MNGDDTNDFTLSKSQSIDPYPSISKAFTKCKLCDKVKITSLNKGPNFNSFSTVLIDKCADLGAHFKTDCFGAQ